MSEIFHSALAVEHKGVWDAVRGILNLEILFLSKIIRDFCHWCNFFTIKMVNYKYFPKKAFKTSSIIIKNVWKMWHSERKLFFILKLYMFTINSHLHCQTDRDYLTVYYINY